MTSSHPYVYNTPCCNLIIQKVVNLMFNVYSILTDTAIQSLATGLLPYQWYAGQIKCCHFSISRSCRTWLTSRSANQVKSIWRSRRLTYVRHWEFICYFLSSMSFFNSENFWQHFVNLLISKRTSLVTQAPCVSVTTNKEIIWQRLIKNRKSFKSFSKFLPNLMTMT